MAELTGTLSSFELSSLVRFLCAQGKTGDLLVARGNWIGQLSFDQGRLSAVMVEGEQGPAALEFVSVVMRDGDFEFSEGPPNLAANLDGGADPLILLERFAAATGQSWLNQVPAPTAVPRVAEPRLADDSELTLGRASIYVLLDLDASRSVRDLAARHGLMRVLKALARLRELGLVTFEAQTASLQGGPGGGAPAGRAYGHPGGPPEPAAEGAPEPAGRVVGWRDRLTQGRASSIALELGQALVVTACLVFGIRSVVENFRVEGTSMQPTFAGGQALVVNRLAYVHIERTPLASVVPTTHQGSTSYVFGGPQRGDVAIFRAPPQPDTDYIKRIIGLPGETILITHGQVYIDGQRLDEPYVDFPASYNFPVDGQPAVVPDGSYFVLGDNRPDSFDSHLGWFVPADNLIGRAWLRYWPPADLGMVAPGAPSQASSSAAVVAAR